MSSLVELIVQTLKSAGYEQLSDQFAVASVRFEFDASLRGAHGRSHDLIIVVDVTRNVPGEQIALRIKQQLEALSRALDVSGSKLVLTTVLAGPPLSPLYIEALARVSRVLQIQGPAEKQSIQRELEDGLRVLLPLALTPTAERPIDPIDELRKCLPSHLDAQVVEQLVSQAGRGSTQVEAVVRKLLHEALAASGGAS